MSQSIGGGNPNRFVEFSKKTKVQSIGVGGIINWLLNKSVISQTEAQNNDCCQVTIDWFY